MKLFKGNTDKIHNILLSIKLTLGGLAISAFAQDSHKLGFYILLAGGLIDIILSSFSSKPESTDVITKD